MTKETLILLLKQYKENKAKLKLKLREKEKLLRKIEQLKDITMALSEIAIKMRLMNRYCNGK